LRKGAENGQKRRRYGALGRCDENGNETQTAANRRILAQMFTQMFTHHYPKPQKWVNIWVNILKIWVNILPIESVKN
jgi:hypothetical protein